MNILLINARSLSPKLYSLIDTMEEMNAQISLVTETWLKANDQVNEQFNTLRDALGYECIRRDRTTGNGGGVAILYKTGDWAFHQLKTGGEFEIVAALGRRTGQRRKLLAITAYIPPDSNADTNERFLQKLVDLIGIYKRRYCDPYFIVGGDFNKRSVEKELKVYNDLKLVDTPPTRGKNTLDLIFTNFEQYILKAGVVEPICNQHNAQSDHLTVYIDAKIPRVPQYTIEKYSYVKQTTQGDEKLGEFIRRQDWDDIIRDEDTTDQMIEKLHSVFEQGMGECYEKKETTKKSSEPPWMTDGIRDLIRQRRGIFKEEKKRTDAWKAVKRATRRMIRQRRGAYNREKKERILSGGINRFHECVRAFNAEDKKTDWSPMMLYEGITEKEAAEKLATYFNDISSEYSPLRKEQIPSTYEAEIPIITEEQVEKGVKEGKRPKSRVEGDIFIGVLVNCIDVLARPIARIFNNISQKASWPTKWKTEFVTIIPKCTTPESEAECRNISCTNYLSKLYERFVLNWCQNYVQPKTNQFGGQKGCSTYHFLAEAIDQITENLEDSRAACILTSIDYSKAFNRVEHLPLLQAFASKGAPNHLIKILATFLTGRTMSVRVGMSRSTPKGVNAGAPQGSVLGTYVFNVATDDLEEGVNYTEEVDRNVDLTFLETEPTEPSTASTPKRNPTKPHSDISPIPNSNDMFLLRPNTVNVPEKLKKRIEPTWRDKPISVRKFVDDNLQVEKLDMMAQQTYQDGQTFKNPRALKSERMFKHISAKAKTKGLLVNGKKTGLLVMSASRSYQAKAHIYDENKQRVDSTESMKMLGFIFNQKADTSTHVEKLCTKFRQKVWSIRKLRKAGFNEEELLSMYKMYIRPSIEYSGPVYHSMLSKEQEKLIERQQFFALKNIYGFCYSHRKLLELSGIQTLAQRREAATLKFAQKTLNNPRFASWFPRRRMLGRNNGREELLETNARTDRRYNSPIFYYRRILNNHRKNYDVRKSITTQSTSVK